MRKTNYDERMEELSFWGTRELAEQIIELEDLLDTVLSRFRAVPLMQEPNEDYFYDPRTNKLYELKIERHSDE